MPFGHLVVLERGDELIASLIRLARHEEIEAATLFGIGAVHDVELGFYHLPPAGQRTGHYERSTFAGPLEACALNGTISLLDGEPFPHVHGVFSRADCSTVGGHVFAAVCHVTLEIALHTAPLPLLRAAVEFCDLKLLQLETPS
jgi:uncharacterized protein